jgi:hypothetical protein
MGSTADTGAQETGGRIMATGHELLADALTGDALRDQVFVLTLGRHRAMCECGWAGHKRLTFAGARVDAWLHAAEAGHSPATPLTLTARAIQ